MKQITTGTYSDTTSGFSGWVEGVRDDGSSWIMYIDDKGSPAEFYKERDESGGVVSDPVSLQ